MMIYDIIQLSKEHGFRRYFKNTAWMMNARVVGLIISFLTIIYVARELGPAQYGELSYVISFVGLFAILALGNSDQVLYRDLIRYPEREHELLGTGFVVKLIAGTVTFLITNLAVFLLESDVILTLMIVIFSFNFFVSPLQVIFLKFQAETTSKPLAIVTIAVTVILNALKILIVAFDGSLLYLAGVLLLEPILFGIASIYLYWSVYRRSITTWSFNRTYAYTLLIDSAPLVALAAFSIIYARIDQVLIRHLMDTSAVGHYAAAVRLTEAWAFVPGALMTALYPAIVNAHKTSEELYLRRIARLSLFFFGLSCFIAIVTTILAPFIITVLYGPAFAESITVLRIYIWAFIGTTQGILVSHFILTENLRKIQATIALIPMILNIVLNLLWIPQYGIAGAAYATLVSYVCMPLLTLVFSATRHKILRAFHLLYT